MKLLSYAALGVGSWMVLNGILHDVFVIFSEHGKKYDRDLLRLLMDGHLLITCGAMQIISYFGLRDHATWAYALCGTACMSLIVYLIMIWPFLKSFGAMSLNLAMLTLLVFTFIKK